MGSYRLFYKLMNDVYMLVIDYTGRSSFMSLQVLQYVQDVLFHASAGQGITFESFYTNKINLYYSLRRCLTGVEGCSTFGMRLSTMNMALDPFNQYAKENELFEVNDVTTATGMRQDVIEWSRDAWEVVQQVRYMRGVGGYGGSWPFSNVRVPVGAIDRVASPLTTSSL